MVNFIKPEYLVSLYLILNDKEIVTLGNLGDYCGELNNALREKNIEAVFLFSSVYIDEMLYYYNNFFSKETYLDGLNIIKRKVPNETLAENFTGYLSNDVLKVACELNNSKESGK